jgi:hypothetical protein
MRQYLYDASRPGGFLIYARECKSDSRIRPVAVSLFRKVFGMSPRFSWHKDGFMAQAFDKRGNTITVTQINGGKS